MSSGVVRNTITRRHTRNNHASPYARPHSQPVKKSSGWSLSGLLSYLNPFASRSEEEDEPEQPEGDAATRLAERGQQLQSLQRDAYGRPVTTTVTIQDPQPTRPPPPPVQSTSQSPPAAEANGNNRTSPRSDDSESSTSANMKKVQQFLGEKGGRPLNHVEFVGLVQLLQESVEDDDDHPEPFRFSKSPSRAATPAVNFLSPGTPAQQPSGSSGPQNGRKTLAKNPMGTYRWQGGGSARPRNRYQSPSFGATPSRPAMKIVTEPPKADSKRRRVGEDASSSSPQRAGPTTNGPTTSTPYASTSISTGLNGTASTNGLKSNGRVNGAFAPPPPATPRVRTTGLKPTAPANPSPLRQTWSQSDSPPQRSPPQPTSKQTRAASFMTELIKEVTPPKKPDFVNPYEAANPMVKPAARKQPVRRTRAAAKAEAQAQKKEPELTPQAIIEATVPKGSKRSRPPPELVGAKSPEKKATSPTESSSPRRSTRLNGAEPVTNGRNGRYKVTVEEVSDEEQQPSPPKKQRKANSPPNVPIKKTPVTVEEVEDVEMSSFSSRPSFTLPSEVVEPGEEKSEKKRSTSPGTSLPTFGGARTSFPPLKSSAPKAPSKLRFSIQADKDEKMDFSPTPALTSFPSTPHPLATPAAAPANSPFGPPPTKPAEKTRKPQDARALVAAMRPEDLPKYDFVLPLSSPGAGPSTLKARQIAMAAPASSLPTYDFSKPPAPAAPAKPSGGFNWAAAGMKPPTKPAGDSWTCPTCMLVNPADAGKCTVCEEPRVDKPKPAAVKGFDWAAAGAKPPPKPTGGQWSCSVCMLSNPVDAEKCTVCDTPR